MRIANNVMALNTHRFYTKNNNAISKSAEKLSSGYRINRAGDDAAGLAISEKMRAQVRGLNMATKNSQDAVSLVQTAEGALQEVHSMLQRMNELAVQSASGTNDSGVDRAALQQEFQNLQDEIDQIASTTTFNDMALLDGDLAGDSAAIKAEFALYEGGTAATDKVSFAAIASGGKEGGNITINISDLTASTTGVERNTTSTAAASFSINKDGQMTLNLYVNTASIAASGDSVLITQDLVNQAMATFAAQSTDNAKWIEGVSVQLVGDVEINRDMLNDAGTDFQTTPVGAAGADNAFKEGAGKKLTTQVGAEEYQELEINVFAMNTKGLFIEKEDVGIGTQEDAQNAISSTRVAINMVSTQRAELGAMQNRLEHKISNLENTAENLTASESRIRDTDIAKEMTNYTKNNILSQAATAMLAQANAAPQSVLSLLG